MTWLFHVAGAEATLSAPDAAISTHPIPPLVLHFLVGHPVGLYSLWNKIVNYCNKGPTLMLITVEAVAPDPRQDESDRMYQTPHLKVWDGVHC